ncbi:putative bifunctional diguanylate cyclase/phosphodiesterase [Altericroceibacterium spongiae]|nr:GGDEF domain-containing protein [Altericroceibacterium spongiae]
MGQAQPFLIPRRCHRICKLETELEWERQARRQAEAIAEGRLRDLYENQRRLTLLQRVTEGANRSCDLRNSLGFALSEICEQIGWAFGCAYLVDNGALEAVGCDIWYSKNPVALSSFIEASRQARFRVGQSMPGLVLRDRKAVWINNPDRHPELSRLALARQCGIVSACAFPIWSGDELAAVIEFLSSERIDESPENVAMMQQIGIQLGRVIERDRSRKILLQEALQDSLTGLPNRLQFLRKGKAVFDVLPEDRRGLAVVVIDLDGFKTINDRHGHAYGDRALVAVAKSLSACVNEWQVGLRKRGQTVDVLPARMSGDEFVVLAHGDAGDEDLKSFARAFQSALQTLIWAEMEGALTLSASIGIAQSCLSHTEFDHTLRDADLAMYEGKLSDTGQIVSFTAQLGNKVRQRRQLLMELRDALKNEELLLYYQPIFALGECQSLVGFEALIRWNHPSRGLLEPQDFIPAAEDGGLIGQIGDWVLEEALSALKRLHQANESVDRPYLSVNIAAAQFLQPNFAKRLYQLMRDADIECSALTLEITESVALVDTVRTAAVLGLIRQWGVRTSLDDFGTGYSSLSYLKNLPFDTLKIDKSFVQTMSDRRCRSIVRAILDIADNLELNVVAEGIETAEQCETMRLMGAQSGQGYLFGRPMSEKSALTLLKNDLLSISRHGNG